MRGCRGEDVGGDNYKNPKNFFSNYLRDGEQEKPSTNGEEKPIVKTILLR